MRNASQFRQLARNKLAGKWGISILVSLVAAVLTGLTLSLNIDFSSINDLFNKVFGKPDAINAFLAQLGVNMRALSFTLRAMRPFIFMLSVARFLLSGAIMLGLCSYYTGLIRGQEVDLNTLFSKFRLFGKGLLLYLYTSLLIFAWSLLFVVPGSVAAYRYSLAFYLLTDNPDMGVAECVRESKRLMLGHKGRLFCLNLSFIGWGILCALSFGIGYLWLKPYMGAASAAFYLERIADPAMGGNGSWNGCEQAEFERR